MSLLENAFTPVAKALVKILSIKMSYDHEVTFTGRTTMSRVLGLRRMSRGDYCVAAPSVSRSSSVRTLPIGVDDIVYLTFPSRPVDGTTVQAVQLSHSSFCVSCICIFLFTHELEME